MTSFAQTFPPKAKRFLTLGLVLAATLGAAACSPAVGSPEWCADMKEKSKGDWSANEAADFAKHCIL